MTDSPRKPYLPIIILTVLVVSSLPVSNATYGVYGDRVGESATETDISGLLLINLASAALKYDDVDTSSTPNTGDRFYLIVDGGTDVGSTDVRLATVSSLTGGKQVTSSDSDHGEAVITTGLGSWAYEDKFTGTGATGIFNLGEALYLDVNNDLKVSAGDVRVITESSAATTGGSASWAIVAASDAEDGVTLTALAGFKYTALDMNGDGIYNVDDIVVLDSDSNNKLGPGDVYLTSGNGASVTAGTMPKMGDRLAFHFLIADADAAFSFDDDANVGVIDDSEPIYLDVDNSATVTVNDIRLGPVASGASTSTNAGKQVATGDTDIGNGLTDQGTLRYRDINGNSVFDLKDDLYLDIGGSSSTEIEAGDLRLAAATSGKTPGTRVKSTDTTEVGKNFAGAVTAAIHYLEFDGADSTDAAYGTNDIMYLDVDDDNALTPGDVRLSIGQSPATTFGKYITRSDTEAESCFRFTFASAKTGYVDESSPGTVQINEGVYLDRAGDDQVSTNDIRLSGATTTLTAGTFVQSGDVDRGSTITELASTPFRFYDANGDSRYSLGIGSATDDVVYLNTNGDGVVSVGDVRISKSGSLGAGSKVQSGDADEGRTLTALPATFTIRGLDADGDGTFTKDDALYINVDHTTRPTNAITDASLITRGCVTPGDVQLSGTGGSAGTTESTSTSTPAATPSNNSPSASITCTGTIGSRSISVSGAGSSDSDGSISTYSWNMGDGSTASGVTATHTYQSDGQFSLRLTVTDNKGASGSRTITVKTPLENTDCAPDVIEPTPEDTPEDSPEDTPEDSPDDTPDDSPDESPEETPDDQAPTPGPAVGLLVLGLLGLAFVVRRRD